MLGYNGVPGLIVLTVRDIIKELKQMKDRIYSVKVSYIEIYNEQIKDLLVPKINNYL